ncbi:hypothetical protein Sru01_30040 [Sphaerisporangium rufum]|uniref:N-acetyltransferase domain-containing protein n=1 Tax=Sphaerisporangium rufum TaxID=1381558 RepID=A0A919R6F8_9ACTN|nr:GNAT family N-acetyltransferase [Sphaerisporangium rufum]GII78022.1 hypothetical protein Sru01_30040 [Sphaerisporangium rufum]
MIRELSGPARQAAAGGRLLPLWAMQGLPAGVRVFASGEAVAVACPALARRDRLVVCGPAGEAVPLVAHALAEVGPSYRPMAVEPLVRELAARIPGLEFSAAFVWMDSAGPGGVTGIPAAPRAAAAPAPDPLVPPLPAARPVPAGEHRPAGWLRERDAEPVAALLAEANPGSYAVPGLPGVRRWSGVRDGDRRLLAVGADAWSAPPVGFIAGVATRPGHRGRGHGTAVCRFLVETLRAEHGRVALMVDQWNATAIALYARLGLHPVTVAAARVSGH